MKIISLEKECETLRGFNKDWYLKALSDILKWLEQRRDMLLCAPPNEYGTANVQIKELDILKVNIKRFQRDMYNDFAYEALPELPYKTYTDPRCEAQNKSEERSPSGYGWYKCSLCGKRIDAWVDCDCDGLPNKKNAEDLKEVNQNKGVESFDDGITHVAPKGQFKAGKQNNQELNKGGQNERS